MRIHTEPRIIFEDNWLLVIAKPAGLVVNRAESVDQPTLQDWAEVKLKAQMSNVKVNELGEVFKQRSGIAHRLDKETSGVMVIGKEPETLKYLMNQFKNRETSKEYLALVHGIIQPSEGVVNLPLGRSVFNRHRFQVDVFGKAAITGYKVLENYKIQMSNDKDEEYKDGFSLVRLFPKTGRTHQIRVHMNHIGHPLVGDEIYGGRKRSQKDREWCRRHFLHAAALELAHPNTGERVRFEADLPDDLQEALNAVARF